MFCFQRDSLGRFKDLTGVTAGCKSQVDLETSWSIPSVPYMQYTIAISLNMAEKISTSSHGYAALQKTRAHISREDIRHSEERQTILEISVWQWPRFKSLRVQAQQQHWLANVLISLTIIIYGISKNMACFAATLLCVVLLNFFKGINSLIYLFFICSFAHTSSDLHDELKIVRFLSGQAGVSLCDDARFPSDFCTNTTSTTAQRYQ